MGDALASLVVLRRRCGRVYTLARDHVLSVSRMVVFQAPCDGGNGPISSAPVVFRSGGTADLEAFTEETHEYGDAEKLFGFERLRRGDSLIVGERAGATVFYAWLMYRQMDLDQNVCVPLVANTAYSYKVFTVQSARGIRLCGAYYSHIKQLLGRQGYQYLVCRIAPCNAASIRAHARAGFERCGLLWKFVLPGHASYYADAAMRTWLLNSGSARYFNRCGFLARYES